MVAICWYGHVATRGFFSVLNDEPVAQESGLVSLVFDILNAGVLLRFWWAVARLIVTMCATLPFDRRWFLRALGHVDLEDREGLRSMSLL